MAQTKTRQTRTRQTKSRQSTARRARNGHNEGSGVTKGRSRRIAEPTDGILAASRKTGRLVVNAYESTWNKVADYQDKVADASKVDWIADVARAQARLTREISTAYSSEARKLIG